MKILIADDIPKYYNELKERIGRERPNYVLVEASNGLEAERLLREAADDPYDILVLDQEMGGGDLDGVPLLERLGENPLPRMPAIIFATAYYYKMPSSRIANSRTKITLFLEKGLDKNDPFFNAISLLARQVEGAMKYHPSDLFGREFIELIMAEVESIFRKEHPGYLSMEQQNHVALLIRSYFTTLNIREKWEPEDVLELTVFLTEGLCHVYDIKDEMLGFVRRFLNLEEVLYTIPRYRDHFFHQIKVFLLGFCILNQLNRDGRLAGTMLSGGDGMKLWFLASAFHDIGYPFEKMRLWMDTFINGVMRSPGEDEPKEPIIRMNFDWGTLLGHGYHWWHLQCITDQIMSYYSNTDVELRASLGAKFAHYVAETPDHGLYSSLILQNFLRVKLSDEQIAPVSVAIALHNENINRITRMTLGQKLTFEQDPLSFLLMYCDLAQDWGRVPLTSRGPLKEFAGLYSVFDNASSGILSGDEVKIEIRYHREFSQYEKQKWRRQIFQKSIEPARNNWAVGTTSGNPLRFSIHYSCGFDPLASSNLDTLEF